MGNVANDLAATDRVIAARVESYLNEMNFACCKALSRAQVQGTLNDNITPQHGAGMLITILLGIGVQAKAGADRTQPLDVADATLKALAR